MRAGLLTSLSTLFLGFIVCSAPQGMRHFREADPDGAPGCALDPLLFPEATSSAGHSLSSPGSVDTEGASITEEAPPAKVRATGELEIKDWTANNTNQLNRALASLSKQPYTVRIIGTYVDWRLPFLEKIGNLEIEMLPTGGWHMDGVPHGLSLLNLKIWLPAGRVRDIGRPMHLRAAEDLISSLMQHRGVWKACVEDKIKENTPPHAFARDFLPLFQYALRGDVKWECGPFLKLYEVAQRVQEARKSGKTEPLETLFQRAFSEIPQKDETA